MVLTVTNGTVGFSKWRKTELEWKIFIVFDKVKSNTLQEENLEIGEFCDSNRTNKLTRSK